MERADAVVIGGGVIGLAVARALAQSGRDVTVLEAERRMGTHVSARNSEVIHAGIYYPPGSLKARLCVEGKHALYDFCATHEVAHRRLGKIIVATTEEERAALEHILERARDNGVNDLMPLTGAELSSRQPHVRGVAGVWSPSTGIVDSHGLMSALWRDAQRHGASLALASPMLAGAVRNDGIELQVGGAEPMRLLCGSVVNAASLWAPSVARRLEGMPPDQVPPTYFAKGHYFTLRGPSPFAHLIYPVPVPGGLGIHVTLDLAERARFGPDVAWVEDVDYQFDEHREAAFVEAIRRYYPQLPEGALQPAYTGIRPKIVPPGAPPADFILQGPNDHGVPGLVNLFGIESPGLTACLAIADRVCALLA